ncbi:uncharacterized protein BCR38DRAFT_410749 [Pseudomassariella vexata]|uniref:Uncharacterized protein n=1 Tax=Pseudomassariella vexata TaxID=1141098 RepID=A0A1Y2DSS1_9PEZI|nr:uncharacterized protein BCR38DRAFT_410749 [Pseudomassariella vexata]ORY62321.1 hypothetical protein BCR38DRAFT_410749 [Pseudomassariella vexata]
MPTCKPKLAQLTTPVTANFPSELQALSAKSPLSAVPDFIKEEHTKTPISPPVAYMDFLKAMSVASPVVPEKRSGSSSEDEDAAQDSMPSTASSERTDCSCKCGNHNSPLTGIPPSPFPSLPMSAPPTGATSFPSLRIPPSPAVSTLESPMSATARSPFSARSVRSPFDWEAALKARYAQDSKATKSSGRSVRHIREVVTRTVTYTPRMDPAPKGKRRKLECTRSAAAKAQAAAAIAAASASSSPSPPALKTAQAPAPAPPAPTTRSKAA